MPLRHGYKSLNVQALGLAPSLPRVQRSAQAHEPALSLLTDLHQSACVVASHRDGLDATLHLMMRAGVRMVFVSSTGLYGTASAAPYREYEAAVPTTHANSQLPARATANGPAITTCH